MRWVVNGMDEGEWIGGNERRRNRERRKENKKRMEMRVDGKGRLVNKSEG